MGNFDGVALPLTFAGWTEDSLDNARFQVK